MSKTKLFLRLGGVVLFLGIAFWTLDRGFFFRAFGKLTVVGITVSAAAAVVIILLGALRWGGLLRAIGCRPGVGSVAASSCIGNALNVLLPTGMVGDFVKILVVRDQNRTSRAELLGTIAIDRMMGLAGFIFVAAVTMLTTRSLESRDLLISGSTGFLTLTFIAIGILAAPAFVILDRKLPASQAVWRRLLASLSDIVQTVYAFRRHPGVLVWSLFISVVAVLAITAALWFLALPFVRLPFGIVVLAVTISAVVSLLPITVNGLGSREFVFVLVLARGGMSAEQAVALSLAWFTVTFLASAGLGALSVVLFPRLVSLPRLRGLIDEHKRQVQV
jgi:glycosyltransferase 2 family protein